MVQHHLLVAASCDMVSSPKSWGRTNAIEVERSLVDLQDLDPLSISKIMVCNEQLGIMLWFAQDALVCATA